MDSSESSIDLRDPKIAPQSLPLHVLLLEDSAGDAGLILHELVTGGYEPVSQRVESVEEMLDALGDGSAWQILLLDYSLERGGTALVALAALDEFDLDLPAILISGPIGAEEAADALRAGARDVVIKGNLTRLVPAISRELARVEARRQRRAGEEALKQSEQRLRLALDAGGLATWEWDLALDRLYWSEKLELMFGLEPGAFGGTAAELIAMVHPEDRELVGASVAQAIGKDSPAVVYRAVWPDGSIHWHERKSQRVLDADGVSQAMVGVAFDVTEREEAAHEREDAAQTLRESEERFRLIAEYAHDLIALLDIDGTYRYLSPSCETILGYPAGALVGTVASSIIHPDDLESWEWGAGMLREVRMLKADGGWLWVEGLSYEIAGNAESHFAVIARDIGDRKRAEAERLVLEDELRQSQKMEAVGQLAGGIAHDFNNLLTVINGYTEILLHRLGSDGPGSREIVEINKAAERAARLTRQLLAYSRKQVLEQVALDLSDVVCGVQAMLERVIGENIEFTTGLASDLPSIRADAGQIEQIMMNLVVNARDAMPGGGRLVLETSKVVFADISPDGLQGASPGAYVMLAVSDTGQGMDATTVGRIFEPFYTTKERGAGTGLGLSTVYGIVKQCGGHIEVESEPGVGTAFCLYFPAVPEPAVVIVPPKAAPAASPLNGTETVLLVEDEEALRWVGKEILETFGYTVLVAGNGAEALELAASHPEPLDLLMTDIMMPRIGGIELAARLSKLRPELRVLYISGYNDTGNTLQQVIGSRYLDKPYTMNDLARTLRELLDPAQEPAAAVPLTA